MFFLTKNKNHFVEASFLKEKIEKILEVSMYVRLLSARRARLHPFKTHIVHHRQFLAFIRIFLQQESHFSHIKIKEEPTVLDMEYFIKDRDGSIENAVEVLYQQIDAFLEKAQGYPNDTGNLSRLIKDSRSLIEHAEFVLGID